MERLALLWHCALLEMTDERGSSFLGGRHASAAALRHLLYTRKSSEEGLEQEFNSLDVQREACEAYVASQRAEGWALVREQYDDGGFSGGTLERPVLQRLLVDIEAGLADVVVVYKIDRLSRSLLDFAKLVEVFDRHSVTFVSVTQSFNTTTSMGRLTLNILLSFAQFEREVIGERIRDKFAASRKRGMWMGGWAPLGYDVIDRKLVTNRAEADIVRRIFHRFFQLGSVTTVVRELNAERIRNKRGKPFDKGFVYKLLNNRVYVGEAVHKGTSYPGEHAAVIDRETFDRVQAILATNGRARAAATQRATPALLKGLLFAANGRAMTPAYTKKNSRLYRYYVSTDAIRGRLDTASGGSQDSEIARSDLPLRLPADMIESLVLKEIRRLLRTPEIVAQAVTAARLQAPSIEEREVIATINQFTELWAALFPAEQARIVRLLVARVMVTSDGFALDLRAGGLAAIVHEMLAHTPVQGEVA